MFLKFEINTHWNCTIYSTITICMIICIQDFVELWNTFSFECNVNKITFKSVSCTYKNPAPGVLHKITVYVISVKHLPN